MLKHPFKDLLNDEGLLRPRTWPKAAPRRQKVSKLVRARIIRERSIWVRYANTGDEATQPVVVDDEEQHINFGQWTPDCYRADRCETRLYFCFQIII